MGHEMPLENDSFQKTFLEKYSVFVLITVGFCVVIYMLREKRVQLPRPE